MVDKYKYGAFLDRLVDIHFPTTPYTSGFSMFIQMPVITSANWVATGIGFSYLAKITGPPPFEAREIEGLVILQEGAAYPTTNLTNFGFNNWQGDVFYEARWRGSPNKDLSNNPKVNAKTDNLPTFIFNRQDLLSASFDTVANIQWGFHGDLCPPGKYVLTLTFDQAGFGRCDAAFGNFTGFAQYQAHGMKRICSADIHNAPNYPPGQDFFHAFGNWCNYVTNVDNLTDGGAMHCTLTATVGETCEVDYEVSEYKTELPFIGPIPIITSMLDKDMVPIPKK